MKITTSILIFLSLFLISCSSSKEKVIYKELSYPLLYTTPQNSDDTYLYGVGEGENLEYATKDALIDISSKLSITISSNSKIYKESIVKYREYIKKEISQNINSKIEELTFLNYKIEKSEKIKFNSFIVLVKVEKKKVIETLKNDTLLVITKFNNLEKISKNIDPLNKYIKYKKILEEFYFISNKIEILKNLDNTYDEKEILNTINKIINTIEKAKTNISFTLKNKTNNTTVVDKIKEEITKNGFQIYNTKEATYNIDINNRENKKLSYEIYLLENNITVDIYFNKQIISSKIFTSKGASSNSFDDALYNSIEKIDFSNLLF